MPPCRKTQPGNWGNRSRGGDHAQKYQAPLVKITGVKSGVITPRDKTEAIPNVLLKPKKATKMINNFMELRLWVGLLHTKTKLPKPSFFANITLKRQLSDCLIKQNIRCIVLKFFLQATYYCSIIALIPSKIKVILDVII